MARRCWSQVGVASAQTLQPDAPIGQPNFGCSHYQQARRIASVTLRVRRMLDSRWTHFVYAHGPAIMIANKMEASLISWRRCRASCVTSVFPGWPANPLFRCPSKAESNSIWEMDANGEEILIRSFRSGRSAPYQCCGNWSPDGDYYYFQAGRGSAQAIWVKPERRSIFRRAAAGPFASDVRAAPIQWSRPQQ